MIELYKHQFDKISSIPSIPEVVTKILDSIDDYRISTKNIAQMISLDPAITAKILSIANSAHFASQKPVLDLDRAITRIGRQEIKGIIMTIHLSEVMNKWDTPHLNRKALWHHALATAFIARKIVSNHYPDNIDSELENHAYLCGLIHDIGYLLFDAYDAADFEKILTYAKSNQCTFFNAEQETMQTDHGIEAAKVLKNWKIPSSLVDAVCYHHDPDNQENILVHIIHLSDYFAQKIDYPSVPGLDDVALYRAKSWQFFHFNDLKEEEIESMFRSFLDQSKLFISFAELIVG